MPAVLLNVLRALVDAAFGAGSISDAVHAQLHQHIDSEDPAIQNAPPPALSDAEQAELARLQAKQADSQAAVPPDAEQAAPAGTEGTGFFSG